MATSIFSQNFPGAEALQQAADVASLLIGRDLHKKTTAICVLDPRKRHQPVFQRKRLQNSDLLATLRRFPGRKVVVCEAAYGWFTLRDALALLPDVTLVLLDPRKTASWITTSGIKNDGIDAQVLCYTCLHGGVPSLAVHQPTREARECCKLLQHREQLVRQRTKMANQRKAIERDYGANPFTGEIGKQSPVIARMEEDLRTALQDIERRIGNADEQIAALSRGDEVVALLRTIPGIGPLTAFALRHKIETIHRFADQAHLSSYFGFGVRQRQSGDRLTKGKIAKTGNRLVRTLLIQGAQVIRFRFPEYVSLYFPTLGQARLMTDHRHASKVVAALARKNLTFAYYVWKNRTPFDLLGYRQRRLQSTAVAPAGVEDNHEPQRAGKASPPEIHSPVSSEQAAELVSDLAR